MRGAAACGVELPASGSGRSSGPFLRLWRAAQGQDVGAAPDAAIGRMAEATRVPEVSDDFLSDPWAEITKALERKAESIRRALEVGRWRQPRDDQETSRLRNTLRDNRSSHPGLAARSSQDHGSPAVRVGISVPCGVLDAAAPSTSDVRRILLGFLGRAPIADLVEIVAPSNSGAAWTMWGGQGRGNHEAVLGDGKDQTAPVAWARVLIPEASMQVPVYQRRADLVLEIERRDPAGAAVSALGVMAWHHPFALALSLPTAFAGLLADELGVAVPGEISQLDGRVAAVAMWLSAGQSVTDLVDARGFQQLRGGVVRAGFDGYAVADVDGVPADSAAVEWIRQLCDNVLHLDDYESALSALAGGDRTEGGIGS